MAEIDFSRGQRASLQDAAVLGELSPVLLDQLRGGDIFEFLRCAALRPSITQRLFAYFEPVFADTCARWALGTSDTTQHPGHDRYEIIGAFARILPFAPHVSIYLESYLRDHPSDAAIALITNSDDQLACLSPEKLQEFLLAALRLVQFDATYARAISTSKIQSLLQHDDRSSRYLAARLFARISLASDAVLQSLLAHYVGDDAVLGCFDGRTIDYTFLDLHEERRARDLTKFRATLQKQSATELVLTPSFSSQVARYGSVLLPRVNGIPSRPSSLFPTKSTLMNTEAFAQALLSSSPVLLYGLSGSGKTALVNDFARELDVDATMVTLHLNEQTDAKMLIGLYTTEATPGSFTWRPGVLTTAVREGRWVYIEDFDRAPNDVISVILPLIERRELVIPSRGETIRAASGFRLIASIRSSLTTNGSETMPSLHMLGSRLWARVHLQMPDQQEFEDIIRHIHPVLDKFIPGIIAVYQRVYMLTQKPSLARSFSALSRPLGPRDLLKWCRRLDETLVSAGSRTGTEAIDESTRYGMFLDAIDCFSTSIHSDDFRKAIISAIAEEMHVPPQQKEHYLTAYVPRYDLTTAGLTVGRVKLTRNSAARAKAVTKSKPFANTTNTRRLLEQVGFAVKMAEPVLLVGETGIGKTTVVQQLADGLGYKLTAVNLSQQSETGDLLGGFKPVNVRNLAIPLKEEFEELFSVTGISKTNNQRYFEQLDKAVVKGQWSKASRLWREAPKMFEKILAQISKKDKLDRDDEQPTKRRKTESKLQSLLKLQPRWQRFAESLDQFDIQLSGGSKGFAFSFVEGNIIKAARNGEWVLLDEINLASPDTLESIADLLHSGPGSSPSILLSETGQIERIKAHPDFRIFGAMNPATDVGKRDLPMGLRSRFTEIYVHSPDRDLDDLLAIIKAYLKSFTHTDERAASDVARLYMNTKRLADDKRLVDGANQVPHFSLRTLTRVLGYAVEIAPFYGLRRALYEGFAMGFLTLLDRESERMLQPLIDHHLLGEHKNPQALLSQTPKLPNDDRDYVRFVNRNKTRQYWMLRGRETPQTQEHYIITPSVERNMLNLVRATSTRRFPVLIQGPTSAGKTSMIEYLAKFSGNRFVRINNHEHTDLQEYLGTYVSDSDGQLRFQEGLLVQALRQGHWIVLDELNLAPTDVLEALNRLLDDNRELLIPETQEIVRPHENFMLFATQNPAGLYGGRKTLSRAFRNRFLELHFDDIPENELEHILEKRSQKVAPSDCKRIVAVYRELSRLRQSDRLFEQKESFATLRDLFRWALRNADNREQLAANGYMLLGERVRKPEERDAVKQVIEKVMKVKIDPAVLYGGMITEMSAYNDTNNQHGVVWTNAMRRLYVLVSHALRNNEPVLLVGETGCGKTTVCQMLADAFKKQLFIVNAHQNTETGDLIGAQRPVRNRATILSQLEDDLKKAYQAMGVEVPTGLDELQQAYSTLNSDAKSSIPKELQARIVAGEQKSKALFEWSDGSLVQAMKEAQFFLLDEISLADDSVLERLNSVLESNRTLLLAEKGTTDSLVSAADGFQFFATMNPGGDYGKRELSPALRNRFTEIWVPALTDLDDVIHIVESKLMPPYKKHARVVVEFAHWFGQTYRSSSATLVSVRDVLAWVSFVNGSQHENEFVSLLHGAAMVYIDTLGANPAALLAINPETIAEERLKCLSQLSKLVGTDLVPLYNRPVSLGVENGCIFIGDFSIPSTMASISAAGFAFQAPTTKMNAMRIIRALQVQKPILIEGSPGVGKTTLVTALAKAAGKPLTRINLSEQTDLMDLFGSDVPMEGAEAGHFAWRDAPFLQAMQNGHWVLLDEMNLASQSVLEGLNACLDHRGEVYISELDQTFKRHPNFLVFAAQNPHHQGGGRKGLPASFVNRFTVVYADMFRTDDLALICKHYYEDASSDMLSSMISFVSKLERNATQKHSFAQQGAPWEFNLRDVLRWLQLLASKDALIAAGNPADFLNLIFRQRFRNVKDRQHLDSLYAEAFGNAPPPRHLYHNLSTDAYQVGKAYMPRHRFIQRRQFDAFDPRRRLPELEAVMICVQQNLPSILVGPSGCGKSALIQHVAAVAGAELVLFPLNSDIDTMDLVGGFEQMDPQRVISAFVKDLHQFIHANFLETLPQAVPLEALQLLDLLRYAEQSSTKFLTTVAGLLQKLNQTPMESMSRFITECDFLRRHSAKIDQARFEWVDGALVKALEAGSWLILDNANLCSSSVLDRLNSLLEPNGMLIINEHCGSDGEPKTVTPHPNFRLFLTMDPQHGELSRAMRNRAVEIFLEPLLDLDMTQTATASTQRLLVLTQALSAEDASQELMQIGLDHLNFVDLSLLPRYAKEVERLLASPESARMAASQIQRYLDISATESAGAMRDSVVQMYNSLGNSLCLPRSFGRAQTLHPLQNSPVVQILEQTSHSAEPFLLSVAYETQLELAEAQAAVQSHVQEASGLKPSKMTRLQRSSIREHSKAVQNDSTIGIYNFLVGFWNLIKSHTATLPASSGNWKIQQRAMRGLLHLWWETYRLGALATFEEARFQAHLAIMATRFQQLGKTASEPAVDSTHDLATMIKSLNEQLVVQFEFGFKLRTGLSMEKLWLLLRPTSAKRAETLAIVLEMERLAEKFDSLRWKTLVSVPALRSIMSALVSAYRLVLASTVNAASLVQTLTEELQALESKIAAENTDVVPFFASHFEILRQFNALDQFKSAGGQVLDNDLNVLANYPTRSLMQMTSATCGSALLRQVEFLGDNENRFMPAEYSFSASLLRRLRSLEDVSLRSLKLLEAELPLIGKTISLSTPMLCQDPVLGARSLLIDLLLSIVGAHDVDFKDEIVSWLDTVEASFNTSLQRPSAYWLELKIFAEYPLPDAAGTTLQHMMEQRFKLVLSALAAAKLAQTKSRMWMAVAWITFAIGCVELYVPDRHFDPDQRQHLECEQHLRMKNVLQKNLSAICQFEQLFSGQSTNLRAQLLEDELKELGDVQPVSTVFRPEPSELDQLQGEFNNLLKLLVLPTARIHEMVDCRDAQAIKLLQSNTAQIASRFSDRYAGYRDLTVPVVSMMRCLQLGFSLAETASAAEGASSSAISTISKTVPFFGQQQSIDISALSSERPLELLSVLTYYKSVDGLENLDSQHRKALLAAFHSCYQQWKQKLEDDRKEAESNTGLYRFKGSAEDEDERERQQFNELFPSFDDSEDTDATDRPNSRDTTVAVAAVHAQIFASTETPSETLKACIAQLSTFVGSVYDGTALERPDLTGNFLPSVLLSLSREQASLSATSVAPGSYNFYTDANLVEVRKLVDLIHQTQDRFSHLQRDEEIGHMQPIEDVLVACRELLEFRHREPLAKIITKVEKIHSFMHEWQFGGWVPKTHTAPELYDDLTKTLVSWRRLELSTWAKLFEMERKKCEDDARSWWFVAYEVVIAAPLSMTESIDELTAYATQLLKNLQVYMSTAFLGQYMQRLETLQNLLAHLELVRADFPNLDIIANALENFVLFYRLFEPAMVKALEDGRKNLEKSMKDVLLTASWKDTNIVALRDSAKRSHHRLFKIVRKYRELLGQPVEQIIQGGIPDGSESGRSHTPIEAQSVSDMALETCIQSVPGWSTKSKRFTNVEKSVSIMVAASAYPTAAIDAPQYLEAYTTDFIATIEQLQKETPAVLTEENSNLVKHLKNRKRKLFADVLKELRQMGIKFNLSTDVLSSQDSLPKVLSTSPALEPNAGVQRYFCKALDLASQARLAARAHSEDLTTAEVARSVGLLEGLLNTIVRQRASLARAMKSSKLLHDKVEIAGNLWSENHRVSTVSTITNTDRLLRRIPTILRVASQIVEVQQRLSQDNTSTAHGRMLEWVERLDAVAAQRRQMLPIPDGLISSTLLDLEVTCSQLFSEIVDDLSKMAEEDPRVSFVIDQTVSCFAFYSSVVQSPDCQGNVPELDTILSGILDSVFVAVEQLKKQLSGLPASPDDQSWLIKVDNSVSKAFLALHADTISTQLSSALQYLQSMNMDDEQIGKTAAALFGVASPLLKQYCNAVDDITARYAEIHRSTCKLFCVLSKTFIQIANKGFCTPSEQSEAQGGKGEKLEDGTGLGDGEGAEDISKDIQDDEDLSELAQEPNKTEDGDMQDQEDAVDMADGELEGEAEEAEEQEKEDGSGDEQSGDELDEEAGDVDDLDPNAVDEKMWDGDDEKAEKDQEGDRSKGQQQQDETGLNSEGADEADENMDGDEAEEDVGEEQGEDVHQESEKHDPKADEGETLDLPDDMQLDGDDGAASDMDEGMDDLSDVEGDDEPAKDGPEQGGEEVEDEGLEPEPEPEAPKDMDTVDVDEEDDNAKEAGNEVDETEEPGDAEDMAEDTVENSGLRDRVDNTIADDPSKEQGVGEGLDENQPDNDNGDSNAQRSDGQQGGDNAEEEQAATQEGNVSQQAKGSSGDGKDDTQASESQPFKKLGDMLEEWHRQNKIHDAADPEQPEEHMDVEAAQDEYRHLQDDQAEADTQALGVASEEQAMKFDDSAIEDGQTELPEAFHPDKPEDDGAMDVDAEPREASPNPYEDRAGAMIKQAVDKQEPEAGETRYGRTKDNEDEVEEVDNQLSITHLDSSSDPTIPAAEAHELWARYESETRDLSLALTEQLRLILAPTLATKMRGDFRTGKRLNIKRIIPYIASQYKRDKIWMRRSVPSKRSYQILIAVDDSRSMGEHGSGTLALETLVMVSKSLSMLEVGEIGVVGFGEEVRVAHEFSAPFSGDAGPRILQNFGFAQRRTDVTKLVQESLNLFRAARAKASSSPADLWQLQLIISDGVCESREHDAIRRLLREALEERIMMVFVIVDDVASKKKGESVMDLKEARFIKDEMTGADTVRIERYLDTFPFRYYIIVSDVRELPGVLAALLRQWFAEVADSGS